MADVRIGILGVGGFGLFCMEQYRQMPGVKITAIAGTKPEKYARLAEEYDIPFHTTDWYALVTHPEVDVVYLATPPDMRSEPAIAAMKAGKHVFCEKPFALSLQEADAMLTAARQYHVRVGINFVMRYSTVYERIRRVVEGGWLGRPQHFVFENTAGDLPAGHWFWDPQRSGTILVEHGVHFFDIYASLFGPGEVRWAGRALRPGGAADKWSVAMQYGDRMFGTFYHAFDKPSPLEQTWCLIDCERGYLRLNEWIPTEVEVNALVTEAEAAALRDVLTEVSTSSTTAEPRWLANGAPIEATQRLRGRFSVGDKQEEYAHAVREALADFIAWTENPAYKPRVTGADGREALRIALWARQLAENAPGNEQQFDIAA